LNCDIPNLCLRVARITWAEHHAWPL
jgi:hypothetical protein